VEHQTSFNDLVANSVHAHTWSGRNGGASSFGACGVFHMCTCTIFLLEIPAEFLARIFFGNDPCYQYGYITVHCARTGDYDSMLIFFIVAYCLSFFNFLESGQNKWIYLTATAIILAVLTKGIAGVMFLPGLLILVFVQKKQKQVAKNKHLYFATAIALFFSVGWFILREIAEPGYLDAVWKNDMGGRYTEVIEHHEQPFAYYFFPAF